MLVLAIGVIMLGLLIIRAKQKKRKWLKTKIENDEFIEGVVTNKKVMENENYFIELDNQYMYKARFLKDYNALPLNISCKIIVGGEYIRYIEGFTTLNPDEDKAYDKIQWCLYILSTIILIAMIYTEFWAF